MIPGTLHLLQSLSHQSGRGEDLCSFPEQSLTVGMPQLSGLVRTKLVTKPVAFPFGKSVLALAVAQDESDIVRPYEPEHAQR